MYVKKNQKTKIIKQKSKYKAKYKAKRKTQSSLKSLKNKSKSKKNDIDTREFFVLVKLPEGAFWVKDVIEVPNKVVKANPVSKFSGDIIGGTQGYQGISGTYESQLAPDGKALMAVYHIVRPK